MKVHVLDEVVELLRQKHVGGWADFESAYRSFQRRHCEPCESEIACLTRFWRYIVSASGFGAEPRESALSALCDTDTGREWVINFKRYVLCILVDIYDALEDYHD